MTQTSAPATATGSLKRALTLWDFGAFIAFMGVNLAALTHGWVRSQNGPRRTVDLVLPLIGFLICLYLWLSLRLPARLAGGAWLATGLAYGAVRTRGFQRTLVRFDVPPA